MFLNDKKCNNQTCINLGFILQQGLSGRSFFKDKERKLVRKLSYWSKYRQHLVASTSIWNKIVARKMKKYFLTRENVSDTAKCVTFINSVNSFGEVQ